MNWGKQRGIALIPILIVVGGIAIVYFVIYQYTKPKDHTVPVSWASCTCDDYDDLKNRDAEAAAAIAEINNNFIPNQSSGEMYTQDLYNANKPALKSAVQKAHTQGANSGEGETKPSCITKVEAPTPCLRAVLQAHENVHAASCDKHIGGGGKGDWKEHMPMVDYWREDASGYAAEREHIAKEINRLNNDLSCNRYGSYPGMPSKEEQQQRLAGAKRRVSNYVQAIS